MAQERKPQRRRVRPTLAAFALVTLAINVAAAYLLDESQLGLRDPEYGRRISHLRAKVAENRQRPLVLVVGSSRTAMGVRPGEWETMRPVENGSTSPLLFNLSTIGGDPLLERVVVQRSLAAGIKPAAVLLEYWPPLFKEPRDEASNIPCDRLGPHDRDIVREYFADPRAGGGGLQNDWLNTMYFSRNRLLSLTLPKWIPTNRRVDWMWSDIDEWGWKPGCDFKPDPSESRTILVNQAREVFSQLFAGYRLDSRQDRAFRDSIALLREHGVEVALIYMPESSEFRHWYPANVEKAAGEHFTRLTSELGLSVVDARTWMEDGFFSDGFHLTRIGASEFTRKLCPEIMAAFPMLK